MLVQARSSTVLPTHLRHHDARLHVKNPDTVLLPLLSQELHHLRASHLASRIRRHMVHATRRKVRNARRNIQDHRPVHVSPWPRERQERAYAVERHADIDLECGPPVLCIGIRDSCRFIEKTSVEDEDIWGPDLG